MPVNQNKRGENSIKKNIGGVHCPNPPNLTLFTVTLRPQQNRHGLPLLRRLNCKWRENVDRFVVCCVCRLQMKEETEGTATTKQDLFQESRSQENS